MKSGVAIGPIFSLTAKVKKKKKNVTNAQTCEYAADRLRLRLSLRHCKKNKTQQ